MYKRQVYAVLERLGIDPTSEKGLKNDVFGEGIAISKNKKTLVEFGLVKKKIAKHFDIDAEVLFANFHWDLILEEIPTEEFKFRAIPKFPKVKRDFALLLDDVISFDGLKETAFKTEKHLLKEVTLFDVYKGKNLPKGKKSYALSFTLQDERKTLTDKQIDKIMNKLQQQFEKEFGASLH